MKKAMIILWVIFAAALLVFGVTVFTASSAVTWRVFSVAMPVAGLSFLGAVILTIVNSFRSEKK